MKNIYQISASRDTSFLYNSVPELHSDTMERVDELRRRNTLDESKIGQLVLSVDVKVGTVMEAFSEKIKKSNGKFDINIISALVSSSVVLTEKGNEEFGKLYRTEIVSRMMQFLLEQPENIVSKEDASKIMERTMAAHPYRSGDASKAMFDAMRMISHDRDSEHTLSKTLVKEFTHKTKRELLALQMETDGEDNVKLGESMTFKNKNYSIVECEILTGGAMTKVDAKLLNKFVVKNMIQVENDGKTQFLAQMQNGCRGNLVVLDVKPTIPAISNNFETGNWNTKIAIGDLPPDIFGEFLKLNPTMHWVEHKDLYEYMETLPEEERFEFEQKLTLYVSGKAQENVQAQLDSLRNDPDVPTDQRELFDAQWKLTQGDDKNIDEAVKQLNTLIAASGTTPEVKEMATNVLAQVEQQFLAENKEALAYRDLNGLWLFRTHLVSQIEEMKDDWWITNQLQFLWTKPEAEEQADIKMNNDFLETIKELEAIIKEGKASSMTEALDLIDQEKKNTFEKAYDEFIKTEMKGTVMAEKDPTKISKQEMKNIPKSWLKMADALREKGQYGQAAEIYESVFWKKLDTTKIKTLTKEEEEKIEKKAPSLEEIEKVLEEEGTLEGMTKVETKEAVASTRKRTIEQTKEKAILTKTVDEMDPGQAFDPNTTEYDAMQKYQDMLGLEKGLDISDETVDFLKRELIINCALIAVSGGVATLARMGTVKALGMVANGGGRLASLATKATTLGARGVQVGRFGKITVSGVALASLEGAVFHEVQAGIVHGQVWSDDHLRGMAMSAVMFSAFRAGNAVYERTAGTVFKKLAGPQHHLNDAFKARYAGNRMGVMGNAMKHRLVRVTGEALPFHVINGTAAGVLDGDWDRLSSGKEFGKNWSTLMMLSLLPRKRKKVEPEKERLRRSEYDLKQYYNHATFGRNNFANMPRKAVRFLQRLFVIEGDVKNQGKDVKNFLKGRKRAGDGRKYGKYGAEMHKDAKGYVRSQKDSFNKDVIKSENSFKSLKEKVMGKNVKREFLVKEAQKLRTKLRKEANGLKKRTNGKNKMLVKNEIKTIEKRIEASKVKNIKDIKQLQKAILEGQEMFVTKAKNNRNDFNKMIGKYGDKKYANKSTADVILSDNFFTKVNTPKPVGKKLRNYSVADLQRKYKSYQFEKGGNPKLVSLRKMLTRQLILEKSAVKKMGQEKFLKTKNGKYQTPQKIYKTELAKVKDKASFDAAARKVFTKKYYETITGNKF